MAINVKPILVIVVPSHINQEDISREIKKLSENIPDYHILMYPRHDYVDKEISIRAIYSENMEIKGFEELKAEVMRTIKEKT